MSSAVDFSLGGVVGLRLEGAGPRELAAVSRQLGPLRRPLAGEPDVVVRFVDRLALSSPVRYIGLDDAGYTDDAFLVLRGKHKTRALLQIPFERVGSRCELLCERGIAAVPLLVPILNLTALGKGVLPLHAAAFVHEGVGVLATGWSKGGKTESLLAFMEQGARYVGDEWVYLSADGGAMFGIPEPIRLWSWHLDSLPSLRARLPRSERARLSMLRLVTGGMGRITANGARHGSAATRTLNRVSALLRTQLCVDLAPERLFPARNGSAGAASERVRPDVVLFVVSHERPEISVQPIDPRVIAERMLFSLQEEDQRLASCYHKFRFAFPERTNPVLERASELRRAALQGALAGKRAFEVRHPYPVSLPELYQELRKVCVCV